MPVAISGQDLHHRFKGNRCRLLYLVGQLRLGGLERQLYYLLAGMDLARYRPAVVVWNLDLTEKYFGDIKALKIPITGYPSEWSPLYKLYEFRALARQVNPEVIHSYGFHTNFAAHYAAQASGALAIGSVRSDFFWAKREGGIIKSALNARWPYSYISNSRSAVEAMNGNGGFFMPRQVLVVRNGLDLNRFQCSNEDQMGKSYIAAVGTLSPIKRWDRLLRVAQKLKTAGVGFLDFRIAGDGPLRCSLEKMAQDLDLSSNVKFIGECHDIPKFLRGAKFLVHTAEAEGCPNAVMEAMACGIPVVAMEAGDIPYLVEEKKSGFVVRQGDERTFGERLLLLLHDNELRTLMGTYARTKAERDFGVAHLVSETLAAYRAIGWKDGPRSV